MSKNDSRTSIQELKDLVIVFGKDRHWQRHHTPKNLAMGIAIEAAELMELYQWDLAGKPNMDEVADELADILFNVLNFAQSENLDITESFIKKYNKLLKKYPAEVFNSDTDKLDDYRRIKKAYRKGKHS
jgi:dCTP diphosphatase